MKNSQKLILTFSGAFWLLFCILLKKESLLSIFVAAIMMGGAVYSWTTSRTQFQRIEKRPLVFFFFIMVAVAVFVGLLPLAQEFHSTSGMRQHMPNYALENIGAVVVDTPDTTSYIVGKLEIGNVLPFHRVFSDPSNAIRPNSLPGDCWAFEGTEGKIIVQLPFAIHVTAISLRHINPSLSPASITTAPKDFTVMVSNDGKAWKTLGTGTYLYGKHVIGVEQIFKFKTKIQEANKYVKLHVRNNWGNTKFTCLYQILVHGELENGTKMAKS